MLYCLYLLHLSVVHISDVDLRVLRDVSDDFDLVAEKENVSHHFSVYLDLALKDIFPFGIIVDPQRIVPIAAESHFPGFRLVDISFGLISLILWIPVP